MKKEPFRDDFYKKIKIFREHNHKSEFKKDSVVLNETKLRKYIMDTFCSVFCDLNEYAGQMGVSLQVISQQIAWALKGPNNKTNSVRVGDIEVLQRHSENYKIGQIRELLADFYRETHYRSESANTEGFYRFVTELIRRYNNDDWNFAK